MKCGIRRYPTTTTDVAVIGWNAAFLYDSAAGAETAIQLLEYANSQLLEFRHYDELLSGDSGRRLCLIGAKEGNICAVATGPIRNEPAYRTAGRGGADRARRQCDQVSQRHVCRPAV